MYSSIFKYVVFKLVALELHRVSVFGDLRSHLKSEYVQQQEDEKSLWEIELYLQETHSEQILLVDLRSKSSRRLHRS